MVQKNITVLHHAAFNNHVIIAKILIEKKVDINAMDDQGNRPLHYAAAKGHTSMVELLIEKGADINAKNSQGNRPLHYAAANGHISTAGLLIEKGANVHAENKEGKEAYDFAVSLKEDNRPMINLLVKNGMKSFACTLEEERTGERKGQERGIGTW